MNFNNKFYAVITHEDGKTRVHEAKFGFLTVKIGDFRREKESQEVTRIYPHEFTLDIAGFGGIDYRNDFKEHKIELYKNFEDAKNRKNKMFQELDARYCFIANFGFTLEEVSEEIECFAVTQMAEAGVYYERLRAYSYEWDGTHACKVDTSNRIILDMCYDDLTTDNGVSIYDSNFPYYSTAEDCAESNVIEVVTFN